MQKPTIEQLERDVACNPTHTDAYLKLGLAHYNNSRKDLAKVVWELEGYVLRNKLAGR
jgi:hypothetical protein